MKAVLFHQHGGLDVLTYTETAQPEINETQALIRVEACALNHLDLWVRQGMPNVSIPLPHVPGCEIVGKVAKVGNKVTHVRVGDKVLVAPGISCRNCHMCFTGRDSLCASFQIVGLQINGGYAEYAAVPGTNLIPISNKLSSEEWAAVPLVFLTAWHMLVTRGNLRAGETVLVQAGGSGVGSAALQVAKLCGAVVYTTASTEKKGRKALSLGADAAVQYERKDFVQEILKLTNRRGVDLVVEHVGPATWAGSVRCLAKGGRLVTCGATTGPTVELDLRFFFSKELTIAGCTMGGRAELEKVISLVEEGKLKPVVDTIFPLKEAAKAQALMESRNFFGKLVLKI